jgi:hypothetical protein
MPPYDDLWPAEFAPKEPLKLLDPKFSRQFCLEQARAFVWGQQPTLANFSTNQLHSRPDEIDYVLRLARLRNRAMKYLLTGTMLRPPVIQVAGEKTPFSRLSIYAGQQGGLSTFEKEIPLAIGEAWRAPDGRIALVLASIAEKTLPVTIRIPAQDYGLVAGEEIRLLDLENKQAIRTMPGTSALRLELPKRGARILEFQ